MSFNRSWNNLLQDDSVSIARDAYISVINLTTEENICEQIFCLEMEPDLLTYLLQYVLKQDSLHADPACQILSNISRVESCAGKIVRTMVEKKDSVGFQQLIQVFCRENYNKNAQLHFLGPFLSNLTQIPKARYYVLDRKQCVVQRLLTYTEYEYSKVRRGGIVGALRNCCFETGEISQERLSLSLYRISHQSREKMHVIITTMPAKRSNNFHVGS